MPEPTLVICTNGHVTDPWQDWDTYSDQPAANLKPARASSAFIEKGSEAWTKMCRRVVTMGSQQGKWKHQCRAACEPLSNDPALESAFALGGEEAVRAVVHERNTRGRTQ